MFLFQFLWIKFRKVKILVTKRIHITIRNKLYFLILSNDLFQRLHEVRLMHLWRLLFPNRHSFLFNFFRLFCNLLLLLFFLFQWFCLFGLLYNSSRFVLFLLTRSDSFLLALILAFAFRSKKFKTSIFRIMWLTDFESFESKVFVPKIWDTYSFGRGFIFRFRFRFRSKVSNVLLGLQTFLYILVKSLPLLENFLMDIDLGQLRHHHFYPVVIVGDELSIRMHWKRFWFLCTHYFYRFGSTQKLKPILGQKLLALGRECRLGPGSGRFNVL